MGEKGVRLVVPLLLSRDNKEEPCEAEGTGMADPKLFDEFWASMFSHRHT